jgi:hypothetical protein
MYHFFPGVESEITSFPLDKGTVSSAALHSWNPVPLTLSTLCAPALYLNTASRKEKTNFRNETTIKKQ